MTSPSDIDGTEQNAALAGELALRLLSADEEAAAQARETADPAFAAEVAAWRGRLGCIADSVTEVAPSDGLWPRIEANLANPASNDNERVSFWRNWAIGSSGLLAASLAAVVVLVAQPGPTPPAPAATPVMAVTRVATLTLENGAAAMTLAYDPRSGELYLAPTAEMAGGNRVPHLWLVMPEGGVQLVGAIDGSTTSRHSLTRALTGAAGTANAVAVSMEAPGHTPAMNKPDGPVVASGELQRL